MIEDIKVTGNPSTINIFKEGDIIPSSTIKDGDVITFDIGITIINPINAEAHTPMVFLNPKMVFVFRSKLDIKILEEHISTYEGTVLDTFKSS